MATKVAFPMPNVEYSLALGSSFAPEAGEEAGTSYAALRYDFRPASADLEQPGVLLLGKDNRVRPGCGMADTEPGRGRQHG